MSEQDPKRLSLSYDFRIDELARNLLRQGRLIEAEVQARRALGRALKSHGPYSVHTGAILRGLNKVIFEQGRYAEAEALARANLNIYRRTGAASYSAFSADARSILAGAILAQDRWSEALAEYDAIRKALKPDPESYKQFISINVNLWLALIKGGRGAEALAFIRPAKVHGAVLEAKAGIDAAAEAFRIADVARGRTVKRALAASSARAAARDQVLVDLARREQDALTQIGALNGLLYNVLSAPGDQQNPDAIEDLHSRIDRLHGAREALMKEIETRFPDYANLLDPKPVSIDETRLSLRPGEALVATYVSEGGTCVWAISPQGHRAFSSTDLNEKRITQMVKALRTSLDPQEGNLGSIPVFDLKTAYSLYADTQESPGS
ncbi:MAG: tetratricopeptide repeat protein [Deltaproteobacteria bacterium]|nr:tetratricopeptide repeat protein [Deltaproteobacteria bacterium]